MAVTQNATEVAVLEGGDIAFKSAELRGKIDLPKPQHAHALKVHGNKLEPSVLAPAERPT